MLLNGCDIPVHRQSAQCICLVTRQVQGEDLGVLVPSCTRQVVRLLVDPMLT